MSTTKVLLDPDSKPPKEALKEVAKAENRTPVFDEDSPRFTKDEMRRMAQKAKERKKESKKPVVALRVSPSTLELAKATGKGYTGFMSRLLDLAINDPELVKRALEA